MMKIYIDDGMITTMGYRANVETVHVWATEYLLSWITNILKKMVAVPKLQCIAADAELRATLKARLKASGFRVTKLGEMLGTDFSAGGALTSRRAQDLRRRKARKRRSKLRWWASAGGDAQLVVRAGDEPSIVYGCHAVGLTPSALRDIRRVHGAFANVKCGGASLTAKLATAGPNFADIDPAVTYVAPPPSSPSPPWFGTTRAPDTPSSSHGVAPSGRSRTRPPPDGIGCAGQLVPPCATSSALRWTGRPPSSSVGTTTSSIFSTHRRPMSMHCFVTARASSSIAR